MRFLKSFLFFFPLALLGANTTVLFQPSAPGVGPFPTNFLTVANTDQKTGLQVNLPLLGACSGGPSSTECINTQLLNQLDGFSVNPRIRVCFSGPVDTSTLGTGIRVTAVDRAGQSIGINQILFDAVGNCAYAKPEQVLDQQTRYLLTVSSAVTGADGKKLHADKGFSDCVKKGHTGYCGALSLAIEQLMNKGKSGEGDSGGDTEQGGKGDLVSASLFTTLSATSWLEAARAQVNLNPAPSFVVPGSASAFDLSAVKSITWMPDTGAAGVNYDQALPLSVLTGVGKIAFGLYLSPLYLNTSGPQAGTIPTTPTKKQIATPSAVIPVSYHLFLPAGAVPEGGFPVIVYGHGLGDSQFGAPTYAAGTWAQKGFATLAIEIVGHGFGPLGKTQIATTAGTTVTVATPGRGIQFSAAPIGPSDGCILPNALATRDCARQTAVDLFALMRTIKDTNGLGLNLNPRRVYYTGQSFGSFYGTLFEAVEPNVAAGALNTGGATQSDVARLSPIARQLGAAYLGSFTPSLLNVGPAPPEAYFPDSPFNDEYVYRDQVIIDSVPGALAIQAAFEEAEWLGMLGDPLSYAPHLRTAPLSGVSAKPILVQLALGDLEVPNPAGSALVRAGALEASTWLLRTDWAAGIDPRILGLMQPNVPFPIYPHRFLSNPTLFDPQVPLATAIGVAAQKQIADFFASGGTMVRNPNEYFVGSPFAGQEVFENPATLPTRLNFLQIQP